jgi:hypothetical protein
MEKKCFACARKASTNKYCFYHAQAFDNLKEHYKIWVHAYDTISWNDFLNKLLQMNETGSWVKDVIIVELKGQ